MYGTKVPNFIGLWSTSLELLKFIGSYLLNLEIKIKLKINIGCAPLLLPLLQEILTNSGNMWSGIVLLQNQITLLHKRDCNRTQDLIPIHYCGHIARNNNQLWFYPMSNASRDHNGATPKPIPFDNTGFGKAFSATSVHTTSTICAIESEPRLVRKKNSSPLPHRK